VVAAAFVVSALGLGACRGAPEHAPPADATSRPPARAPSAADAVAPAPAEDADAAIVELKAAARKRLAADRAAVANRVSFEQALERLARDARMTRMYDRIPDGAIDPGQVRQALARYAQSQGVALAPSDVTLGASPPGEAVPLEYRGDHPFPYTEHQLLEPLSITIRLRGASDEAVHRFYRMLPGGVGLLVDLTERWREGEDTVLSGHVYRWRDVTPPRHLVAPPTLASLARAAGVHVPQGHPRLGEVKGLLDEWAALRPALERVLEVAGRAHLAGARADLYLHKTRAIEARRLPPLGAQAGPRQPPRGATRPGTPPRPPKPTGGTP